MDGSVYVGEFCNGLAHGVGTLRFANHSEYCGSFFKAKFCGLGRFVLPNRDIIYGEFFDGKVEGRGNKSVKCLKNILLK